MQSARKRRGIRPFGVLDLARGLLVKLTDFMVLQLFTDRTRDVILFETESIVEDLTALLVRFAGRSTVNLPQT